MPSKKIQLICACGTTVTLKRLGEDYQNAYDGVCPECGKDWFADYMEKEEEED